MVEDAARARRQTRAPSTKRASDGRGCQPFAETRPRRRLWTWRRHALARRAWLASHGGRLLCSGTGSRAVDGRGCRGRCRRAHRLDRERSHDLDGGAGALRSRCLLVHPRGRLRGRHGGADGERRRSGRDLVPGWTPPDRSQHRSCHGREASQVQVSVEGAVAALDSNVWDLVVAKERPRAVAGTGVDAVIRARRRT